ncbi:MAG TPA: LamG-like jellyroll fold domain-containing protein, partial [Candidatus Paceibacterota bacterium]
QNASGSRVSDAAESLKIGNDKSFARTFDGMIDDVRIFNRALTPKEIQQIAAMPTSLSPLRKELTASIITSLERIVKIMQKILGQVQ